MIFIFPLVNSFPPSLLPQPTTLHTCAPHILPQNTINHQSAVRFSEPDKNRYFRTIFFRANARFTRPCAIILLRGTGTITLLTFFFFLLFFCLYLVPLFFPPFSVISLLYARFSSATSRCFSLRFISLVFSFVISFADVAYPFSFWQVILHNFVYK